MNDMGMIYENHFSLKQRPFTIAPNPDFLYANGQYQEALAALEYGMLHRGGFVLLTGEVGTGKTTLCKYLLSRVPENTEVALILHPQLDRLEMLQLICREFGVAFERENKELDLIDRLTEFLLQVYSNGGYSVLIIDEAQHLDTPVLELVRLLTNLETHQDKLLQIILLGQPELKERLQQYSLRQLNQRFTARYHLNPLSFNQLKRYVQHRIGIAGGSESIFTLPGLIQLHRKSGGIPRLINLIADRSLMGGYATDKNTIGCWIVTKAANEVIPTPNSNFISKMIYPFIILLLMLTISLLINGGLNIGDKTTFESLGYFSESSSSAEIDKECLTFNGCWQGKVPMGLLQNAFKASPLSFEKLNVIVQSDSQWKRWSLIDLPSYDSKLIDARINLPSEYGIESLKPGDIHSSIKRVRGILNRLDKSNGLLGQSDTTNWKVIQPSNLNASPALDQGLIYDLVLESRIRLFQKKYGLMVDGVIGGQTVVSLELLSQAMGVE